MKKSKDQTRIEELERQIQTSNASVAPAFDANAYQKMLDSLSPTPTY